MTVTKPTPRPSQNVIGFTGRARAIRSERRIGAAPSWPARMADPAQMGRFCAHEPWADVPYCGMRVSPTTALGLVALANE